MAQGAVLNPSSEHVTWLGPTMTSPATGCGDGRTGWRGFIWEVMMVVRLPWCHLQRSHPDTSLDPHIQGTLRLLLSLFSSSQRYLVSRGGELVVGLVIVIAVCCASLVFLTVLVIICYKAIKR